jgi:phospholipase C
MRKSQWMAVCTAAATAHAACSSTQSGPGASDAATTDVSTSDVAMSDAGSSAVVDATTDSASEAGDGGPVGLQRINHLVVILLENWSYDSLYAEFDAGDGLVNALQAPKQTDTDGAVYPTLPQTEAHLLDASLPNGPFALDPYVSVDQFTSLDNTNNFYVEQMQIHDGGMDLFVALDQAKGLTMGYFRLADLPLAGEAAHYTLCDRFFHAVFGGSLQNNMFLISASLATFPDASPSLYSVLDDAGQVLVNRPLTPDGYVVGTLQPAATPHGTTIVGDAAAPAVPPQTAPTIGDELSAAGVDWAWFAGGWNDALAGVDAGALFQYHHQSFVYFANYAEGTPGRAHLKDETDFLATASGEAGSLPAVSFVKPVGIDNEHPNYANVFAGEEHAETLVETLRNGPFWKDTAIIITYDENGGFWDHVPPPKADRWGPGTRIPAIVISPFARKGFVDHTPYDTASITALIEHRWGLTPLGTRDRDAADMTNAFDFAQ